MHRFLSSGDISWFAALGRRLLGPELAQAEEWAVAPTTNANDTSTVTETSTLTEP